MLSKSLYALCFLALLAFAHASSFKRLHFNQGKTNLRNLDASDSTSPMPSFPFHDYSHNFAVAVNLGEEYLNRAGMSVYSETDMLLLLYTNVTGFCSEHSQFVQYKCENNSCNADTSVNETMFSPYIIIRQGDPVAHKVMIGRDDSAWQLEANAILFNHTLEDIQNIILDGGNRSYIQGNDTYGFIGLGVGGDAYKNFKGDHPLFSIQVDGAGKGQLIFGKDDKLYDYTLTPTSLPASTNWTLLPSSITFGPIVDAAYRSKILFDLQSPGVGLDTYFFDGMFDQLKNQYQLTKDTSYGNDDFHYVFKGELSQLPFLNITLDTDEVISIPPSGYTRRVDNNTYVILLYRVDPVVDEFGVQKDFTMLGWPVLSQFYTIFELTKGFAPVITMYPTYATSGRGNTDPVTPVDPVDPTKPTDPDTKPDDSKKPDDGKKPDTEIPNTDVPTASNPWIIRGAGILIVVVIILVVVKVSQKKSANKLEEDLNVGLTGSAVL